VTSVDPLHGGENVFYDRETHESIHEFVNKVKSGARGLGPEKRIKLSSTPQTQFTANGFSSSIPLRQPTTPHGGPDTVHGSRLYRGRNER
jgi:hypothetical protein